MQENTPNPTMQVAKSEQRDFEATVQAITGHLKANRANALPLCACLATCEQRLPYREAEAMLDAQPVLAMSMQNAHTLITILVECGAIEKFEVVEPTYAPGECKQDMPVDYTLQTTPAGKAAAEQFKPSARFEETLKADPALYGQAYAAVLKRCKTGASKTDIETLLQNNPALYDPKQVYPSYFISKLETLGALIWDDSWKTTEEGQHLLALIG